jgi:hypothetical protein
MDDEASQTVAEIVGVDRCQLDDFAFYMLGLERRKFHLDCNVKREQRESIFEFSWRVFHLWQDWICDNG